jgi:hypothetical protein
VLGILKDYQLKKERNVIILPDTVNQALVGILLGDGHIQQRSPTQNSSFIFGPTNCKRCIASDFVLEGII